MEYIEVSAKTVEDAVLEAAIRLGTTRDKVAYEVITQGSAGFFGIGSKKAVIKAHQKSDEEIEAGLKSDKEMEKILEKVREKAQEPVKEEKKEEPVKKAKAPAPKNEREDKPSMPKKEKSEKTVQPKAVKAEKTEKVENPVKNEKAERTEKAEMPSHHKPEKPLSEPVDTVEVETFLYNVFAAMDMKVEIKITQNLQDCEMNIDLSGDDMGVLIGKRGQTLDSLQYLASLVVNKGSEEYVRVKVDTENYRERRKATLENLAKNIAQKVKRTRKSVALEPMNPYERRVIHSALQNDKFVTTHSEGEEPYRKVVVSLKEGVRLDNYGGRNRNRYNRNYNKKKER